MRAVLTLGLLLLTGALALTANLPVDGRYVEDLLAPFVLAGIGLGFGWVATYIAGMTGIRPADAGIASGLLTTSRQVGGAIGLAITATVSTTATSGYLDRHPTTDALSGAALNHGFATAFVVLAAIALAGALAAAVIVTV